MEPGRRRRPLLAIGVLAALLLIWLGMMVGGTGPLDLALLRWLYWGSGPAGRSAALLLTNVGEWQVLVPLTLAGTALLVLRNHSRAALLLITISLLGRALVELQKWGIARLRPDDLRHLVSVKSLSFPSAHAANSMTLFLSLALLAVPSRHRTVAVVLALAASFAVGITRPMLGVHWPSDVVGGWAFGALWTLAVLWLAERAGSPLHIEGRGP
jgi:undecaprenyl-diphosphatase